MLPSPGACSPQLPFSTTPVPGWQRWACSSCFGLCSWSSALISSGGKVSGCRSRDLPSSPRSLGKGGQGRRPRGAGGRTGSVGGASGWWEGPRDPMEMSSGMKAGALLTTSSSAFALQCCSPESWVSAGGPFQQQPLLSKEPWREGRGLGGLLERRLSSRVPRWAGGRAAGRERWRAPKKELGFP